MSEVAEDSLLGGSKEEAAVSTAQDGVEGAAGVWYVCDASTERDSVGTNTTHDFWMGETSKLLNFIWK